MNKNLINALFLMVGILFGIIFSTGLHYPLELNKLDEIKTVCGDQPIKRIKIGITGKIVEVECANAIVYRLN